MNRSVLVGAIALGVVVSFVPGCKTSKEVAADVSGRSVRDFQFSLEQMPARIDAVLVTMNKLGSAGPAREAALTTFSTQLKDLRTDAMALAEARDRAQTDTQRYFREWLKESRRITDPAARDRALDEIAKGTQRTDIARNYLDTGAKSMRTMVDAMNSIESQLKQDINSFNTPAFNRQFSTAVDSATSAKARIERLGELIDTALQGK